MSHFAVPDVRYRIARVGLARGEDPALLLATSYVESGHDPHAVGDAGCSFGPFQMNRCGGAGAGIAISLLEDPVFAAQRFVDRLAGARRDCRSCSPGELAALAQRPADPLGFAAKVDAELRRFAGDASGPERAAPPALELLVDPLRDIARERAGELARAAGERIGGEVLLWLLVVLAIVLIAGAIGG